MDNNGRTVAHHLAFKGIIPTDEWKIDPLNKDYNGNTVALHLAS